MRLPQITSDWVLKNKNKKKKKRKSCGAKIVAYMHIDALKNYQCQFINQTKHVQLYSVSIL